MTFRELYEQAVNLSREERVNLARNSGGKVLKAFEDAGANQEDRLRVLLFLTSLFVGADGVLDEEEYRLFCDVTGYDGSKEELLRLLQGGFNADFVASMDKAIDGWPDEIKAAACFYGLAFISADGTVSAREQQVFERILA